MMTSNYSNFSDVSMLGLHFHLFFMMAFAVGSFFFIYWAVKYLKKDKLFKLAMILLVTGLLGGFLTMSFAPAFGGFGDHHEKMEEFMENQFQLNQ